MSVPHIPTTALVPMTKGLRPAAAAAGVPSGGTLRLTTPLGLDASAQSLAFPVIMTPDGTLSTDPTDTPTKPVLRLAPTDSPPSTCTFVDPTDGPPKPGFTGITVHYTPRKAGKAAPAAAAGQTLALPAPGAVKHVDLLKAPPSRLPGPMPAPTTTHPMFPSGHPDSLIGLALSGTNDEASKLALKQTRARQQSMVRQQRPPSRPLALPPSNAPLTMPGEDHHAPGTCACMPFEIDSDSSPYVLQFDRHTTIHSALVTFNSQHAAMVVRYLVDHGANIGALDSVGRDTVCAAAAYGRTLALIYLLAKGGTVKFATRDRYTALHYAAMEGHPDACRVLVRSGADLRAPAAMGFHPLHVAVANQHVDVAALLIELGADVNAHDAEGNVVPLHLSTTAAMTELLLEKGGDPNILSKKGWTALHTACFVNNWSVALAIMECAEMNVNSMSETGETPLSAAVMADNLELVAEILQRGADPNHLDKKGNTPFHLAASAPNGNVDVATYLFAKGGRALCPRRCGRCTLTLKRVAEVIGDELLKFLPTAIRKQQVAIRAKRAAETAALHEDPTTLMDASGDLEFDNIEDMISAMKSDMMEAPPVPLPAAKPESKSQKKRRRKKAQAAQALP